eukprot:CAMPEP_0173304792 /NCGR_PEP_ID=MMETSP1143-20121109/19636_1 /TAXON_ID=483371 /ORGANISM="non described non described, Strain CCMP2298" /LENGTH=316 /DNA_ID=CAMNT_0014245641 /DNA_START=33 /DNA_END=980 /DNA_ORIENTATION=-
MTVLQLCLMACLLSTAVCFLPSFTHTSLRSSSAFSLHMTDVSLTTEGSTEAVAPTRRQSMMNKQDLASIKSQILQLGAALDRGQAYNPTSGEYYAEKMQFAKRKIASLIEHPDRPPLPTSLADFDGEWELVLTTVPHGIFRSSPFFLAIQEAYAMGGDTSKALLFFKLHELQTCSWGVSKVGRVAQVIDAQTSTFVSEFDTSLFSLTSVPLLGWGKLLPTFGGRVVTVSKVTGLAADGTLSLEVDYTTAKPVRGLSGLGEFVWGTKVPVGAVWKLLPWNKGRAAVATIKIRYSDEDFRIMEDVDGEMFIYTRPVFM